MSTKELDITFVCNIDERDHIEYDMLQTLLEEGWKIKGAKEVKGEYNEYTLVRNMLTNYEYRSEQTKRINELVHDFEKKVVNLVKNKRL
jgi:hypothetical protein